MNFTDGETSRVLMQINPVRIAPVSDALLTWRDFLGPGDVRKLCWRRSFENAEEAIECGADCEGKIAPVGCCEAGYPAELSPLAQGIRGLEVDQARRMKELERENIRLKRLLAVADQISAASLLHELDRRFIELMQISNKILDLLFIFQAGINHFRPRNFCLGILDVFRKCCFVPSDA